MSTRPLQAYAYCPSVIGADARRIDNLRLAMTFLLRSAFWLSIVYAHMPFDGGEAVRAVGQTQSAIVASAAGAARDKCAQNGASCRAIFGAAAGILLPAGPDRPLDAPAPPPRAAGKAKAARPSANSLSAADLASPWRGRPARS
jgi:hypothetical protein